MSAILILCKRGCLHCDILHWHSELLGLHLSTLSFTSFQKLFMLAMLADLFQPRVVCVARIVKSVSYLSCVSRRACSNMVDNKEAVLCSHVQVFLVFCALDLHQSQEQLQEKVKWTCPPQSTLWRCPLTRVVRVAPCCPTSATRTSYHVKSRLFPNPYAKTHGLDR